MICTLCNAKFRPYTKSQKRRKLCLPHYREDGRIRQRKYSARVGEQTRCCPSCNIIHNSPGYCGLFCLQCRNKRRRIYIKKWRRNFSPQKRKKDKAAKRRHNQSPQGRANQRRYRIKLKQLVISKYSRICVCCKETRIEFLSIDHINQIGWKNRKSIDGGYGLYCKLKRENFPPGYQVLCRNCNGAKSEYWACPHQPNFTVKFEERENTLSSKKYVVARRKADKLLRSRVITNYGDKCTCCEEARHEFLSIDHVNNDGSAHRRKIKKHSGAFYSWLDKQEFQPDKYQILCRNCNCAKSEYKVCPHNSTTTFWPNGTAISLGTAHRTGVETGSGQLDTSPSVSTIITLCSNFCSSSQVKK